MYFEERFEKFVHKNAKDYEITTDDLWDEYKMNIFDYSEEPLFLHKGDKICAYGFNTSGKTVEMTENGYYFYFIHCTEGHEKV